MQMDGGLVEAVGAASHQFCLLVEAHLSVAHSLITGVLSKDKWTRFVKTS